MTRRRWIADSWDDPIITGSTATLEGDQAAHLARVLRAQPGMEYDLVAGDRVWHAAITQVNEALVTFQLMEELQKETTLDITVLLSVFKFDRFEWAIEKLTELGVSAIQPVLVRRTEKHLAQAAPNRVERWRRLATEASKQSRRATLPEIYDPLPLKSVVGQFAEKPTLRLLLSENEKQHSLLGALQNTGSQEGSTIVLAIGPEGGWASEEESLFVEHSWSSVKLGTTILRAETAAIAAVAVTASWMNG